MLYYTFKLGLTLILIIAVTELAKRETLLGGLVASIPLISVIAMFWLYIDTRDVEKVSALSTSVFWLVIPSLALFISLPLLLKQGVNFYLSIAISIGITVICYWIMLSALNYFGFKP